MSKFEKLIKKILDGQSVSYKEAETLLLELGFELRVRGSHHVFSGPHHARNVSLKSRSQLLPYQIRLLQEVLKDYGY